MQEASTYGRKYWCVKIPPGLSEDNASEGLLSQGTELYLYADTCSILQSGALEFRRVDKDEQTGEQVSYINLAFAPGKWIVVYLASPDEGHALAVES